eukprot:ANDGO_05485.mRNA.1 Ras-related protein Rab-32B
MASPTVQGACSEVFVRPNVAGMHRSGFGLTGKYSTKFNNRSFTSSSGSFDEPRSPSGPNIALEDIPLSPVDDGRQKQKQTQKFAAGMAPEVKPGGGARPTNSRRPIGTRQRAPVSISKCPWIVQQSAAVYERPPKYVSRTGVPCDTVLKILLVGNSGVGKSTLVRRNISKDFLNSMPTIGLDVTNVDICLPSFGDVCTQVYDIGGQDHVACVANVYVKYAHAAFIVVDATNLSDSSFEAAMYWKHEIQDRVSIPHSGKPIPFILLLNKIDLLTDSDELDMACLKCCEFAAEQGFSEVIPVSAVTGCNVAPAFQRISERALQAEKEYITAAALKRAEEMLRAEGYQRCSDQTRPGSKTKTCTEKKKKKGRSRSS